MNLILQGLNPNPEHVRRVAAIAGANDVSPIDSRAYCCRGVLHDIAIQDEVAEAALKAELDYAFVKPDQKLSDFELIAMDMDSTLISIECIDEIADMHGLKLQVAEITEAAMRGEIEFKESLVRRVALLKGLEVSALQRVYDERLTLSPGAQSMLRTLQNAGLKTLLISGGFTFFTARLKERLGLDYAHANQLDIVDGRLTGQVTGGIVDGIEKKHAVERVCRQLNISSKRAIVVGDGANDLAMMSVAGLSVAFRAKPVVRGKADIALNFVGLDGILNLFEQ